MHPYEAKFYRIIITILIIIAVELGFIIFQQIKKNKKN